MKNKIVHLLLSLSVAGLLLLIGSAIMTGGDMSLMEGIRAGFAFTPRAALAQTQGDHAGHGGTPPAEQKADDPWAEFEQKATIEIPADQQKLIGVKTEVAAIRPLTRQIRTIGRIEYDERRLATINIKFEGWIERLHVNATGDFVERGAPVMEIYSPELYATQQEYLNILKWTRKNTADGEPHRLHYGKNSGLSEMLYRDAEAMLDAARQRLKLWDISSAQLAMLEKSGTPMRTLTIYSPVTGYVLQKPALQGMRVMPGEKLLDLVDLSTVWVIADIYEPDLPFVKIGQKATITLTNFARIAIDSTIDFLYPTLAGETRTAKARFTVPNPDGKLKPQMYSDVEIVIDLGSMLTVSAPAVINTGDRHLVYVDQGGGQYEPREVTIGMRAEGLIELTTGLEAGERVVSEANFLIDSEARLKGVVQ